MGDRIARLMTRAAAPSWRPALGNLKSVGAKRGRGVSAGTSGITYMSAGQPMRLDWSAQQLAKEAYLGHTWVMACTRTIANTIAGLPWVAGTDPTDPADYTTDAVLAKMLGPATPQAPGGPNRVTSSRAFWAWSICQYIVTGRFAWEAQLTGPGKNATIVALWPLVSAALSPIPSMSGTTRWFDGFQYTPATGTIPLKPEQVIYCWRPSITTWRQPESVLQAAQLPIFIAKSVTKYIANLLKNDLVATTMVISPPFEEKAMRRAWQDQFMSEFTGVDRAGATIFGEMEADETDPAGKPLVQVEKLATTPIEAGLTEAQTQAKIDITIALGVPESLIGNASQRSYSNADQENHNFWTITVLPMIAELQDHINLALAPRLGTEVGWFDLSRVAAVQPPPMFAPPTITSVIQTGVATVTQIANVLGIPAANSTHDTDTTTVEQGAEVAGTGANAGGSGGRGYGALQLRALSPERRQVVDRWFQEAAYRMGTRADIGPVNTWTLQGLRKVKAPERERIVINTRSYPLTTGKGFERANELMEIGMRMRAVATADRTAREVHKKLATSYPESTLGWVDDATWSGPQDIPLDQVQMTRRPGGRDMEKVSGIAAAIAKDPTGPAAAPVVLVKTPTGDKLKVADGYHRTLAHRRMGDDSVPAYVGKVDDTAGPWDREMHDKKLNRSVELLQTRGFDAWLQEMTPELEALVEEMA